MIFSVVILHYKTETDTIECIESVKRMRTKSEIVVVDNASNNGSIEVVEKRYSNDFNIHVIKNENNLGFASGNNVGYQYAKNILGADFIAVSNNDIVIDSLDLWELVINYYEKEHFHLIGPDIESLADHEHQNPMNSLKPSKSRIRKEILRYRCLLFLSRLGVYDLINFNKSHKIHKSVDYKKMIRGIQLHGSFVIFSPEFVKNEEYAFRPGTFLYMEEDIMYQYCIKKGYKTLYIPDIKVFHKEDSSTNSLFGVVKEKREFVFENMIRSLKVYKDVI